jgi:hypothetical protein
MFNPYSSVSQTVAYIPLVSGGSTNGRSYYMIYRKILNSVDLFTSVRFTVTGASPAARPIRVLPMIQHA